MMPLKKTRPSLRPEGRTSRIFDSGQKCSSHLHTPKAFFTQSAFTLIEQKKKSNTSLRPQGRTSRLPQANSSHLHIFTQSAFTLIELLVVVAIIGILATLLFPVTASLRSKGRTALCLSNIRQVGMLHLMYTENYNDIFCPAWDTDFNQWDSSGDYKKGGTLSIALREVADANKTEVFSCPEAQTSLTFNKDWTPRFAGYGYNYLLSFASSRDFPPNYRPVSLGKVRRPSAVIIAADAACYLSAKSLGPTSFTNPPSSGTGGYADFRHDGRAIAVYVDGHAASNGTIFPAKDGEERLGYLTKDDSAYDPFFSQ